MTIVKDKLALSVKGTAEALDIGTSKVYQMVASGELPSIRLCCVLCAKALEQKERSWHKVACRSRPTHKGVTP